MVAEGDWKDLLKGSRHDNCTLTVDAILIDKAKEGGSQPFQVRATNRRLYWLKPVDNPQGPRVPATEQIVARCGHLIKAPVCEVDLVRIPTELAGHRLSTGRQLTHGIAHGSADLATATFASGNAPAHRERNNNSTRHAYIFALHDWCWGADSQWLHDTIADMMVFSHDHGHFLPGGPGWTGQIVRAEVENDHSLGAPPDGLNPTALKGAADAIEQVSRADLVGVLSTIPLSWPVTDADLETVGFFLERRRKPVAARLRSISAQLGA
jgi:hypothetical protein